MINVQQIIDDKVDYEPPVTCGWCGTQDVFYTDCDVWACEECAYEYDLNTDNPGVNGLRKWCR